MIVVADTSPINYLIIIHEIDLLNQLFEIVVIPPAVFSELKASNAPPVVKAWLEQPPSWLIVRSVFPKPDPRLDYLDDGERKAIALAEELQAGEILIDDEAGRREAKRRDLRFVGTLGILRRSAQLGLIDLPSCLGRLLKTTFRVSPDLIDSLLAEDAAGRRLTE